ncbi:MAG: hypothetical protein LBS98_02215 [Coriobacteriales bacterium]|nr:hypothetical protein [Coriobacteriales bacterium]
MAAVDEVVVLDSVPVAEGLLEAGCAVAAVVDRVVVVVPIAVVGAVVLPDAGLAPDAWAVTLAVVVAVSEPDAGLVALAADSLADRTGFPAAEVVAAAVVVEAGIVVALVATAAVFGIEAAAGAAIAAELVAVGSAVDCKPHHTWDRSRSSYSPFVLCSKPHALTANRFARYAMMSSLSYNASPLMKRHGT